MAETSDTVTSLDPVQGLIDFVNDVKPYHTKIVEVLVEYVYDEPTNASINETIKIDVTDYLDTVVETYYMMLRTDATTNCVVIMGDFASVFVTGVAFRIEGTTLATENGIYSSITTLDQQKSKYYDFATVCDENELVPKDENTKKIFQKIMTDKSLLIHIPKLLEAIYDDLPCDMFCTIHENIHNVTIDADGTIRLCLRIRGIKTPSKKFVEYIDMDGKISEELSSNMASDYRNRCRGCIWTCMYMSNMFSQDIVDH